VNPDAALKALAEPHRRAILQLVSHDARSVGDIASHLDITPQDQRREGTRHLFLVNPGGFSAVQQFLADFWTHHLGQLHTALHTPSGPADGEQ